MKAAIVALLLAGSALADTAVRGAFNLKRGAAEEEKPRKLQEKQQVNRTYANHEIEVWYINQAQRTDRKECVERQLLDMGIEPHRFEAVQPTPEGLKEGGEFHDCVKGGMLKNSAYIDAGNGMISSGEHTKMAILGDSCSHKRLFEKLASSKSTAKYFVILEDDVILNPLKFKTAINGFVDEQWGYKGPHAKDFQLVQLDFVGSFCKDQQVGRAGGKRVFKPKNIYMPGYNKGADCARYFGTQAMLLQKDTLASVVDHMESHKTVPMDHLQGELPRALAWRPQIAHQSSVQKRFKLPEFCSKKSRASSITLKGRDFMAAPKKAARETKIDINSWVDEFKMQTPENSAADDVKADDE